MKTIPKQSGFSLIELMVSVAISMLVLAGVASMFTTQKVASRTQDASSQLQESARFVLQALSGVVKQAGFQRMAITPQAVSNYGLMGWAESNTGMPALAFTNGANDTLTVRFHAAENFNPANGIGGDCTGAAPVIVPAASMVLPMISNAYSVDANGQLICTNIAGAQAVLATNVLEFQVRVGLAATVDYTDHSVVAYQAPNLVGAVDMDRVRAVEVCFVLRSDNPAGQSSAVGTQYMGCNGPMAIGVRDGRLRQMFRQSFTIRNAVLKAI
jgi:type IV pilus assembly protein PilW